MRLPPPDVDFWRAFEIASLVGVVLAAIHAAAMSISGMSVMTVIGWVGLLVFWWNYRHVRFVRMRIERFAKRSHGGRAKKIEPAA